MKHMKLFGGPELQGKKEKGKKKKGFEINVQPASVRRSKDNGTRRRGRKALGTRRPPKDRTGPRKSFVLDDGETISLPCLGKQKKKQKTKQLHDLQKAVDNMETLPRRHTKQ